MDNINISRIIIKMTREQIEKEGWTYTSKAWDDWYVKEGYFDMMTWMGRKAVMSYNSSDLRLRIYIDDFGYEHVIFHGVCPDFETFKLISKLVLNEENKK
jgi:hypothetical protein